jgi:hypothetical protein
MSRFGQFLNKRGFLTRDQLQEALEHQAVYGARLGTNLIELHMMSPDRLAEALAEFHGAPLPPRAWLERPGKAAVKRVTRPLVERIRFIPLRYVDKVLHVAVQDPNDPGVLDNLRFATGCRIKAYVMPEIWIHDWLFTLFQIPRGIRHIEVDYPTVQAQTRDNETPLEMDLQAMQAAAQAQAQAPQGGPNRPSAAGGQPVRQTLQGKQAAPQAQSPPAKQTLQGRQAPAAQPAPPPANVPPPMPFSADEPWAPSAVPPIPALNVPGARMSAPGGMPAPPPPPPMPLPMQGESVRPPHITVRSLADLANSASAATLLGGLTGSLSSEPPPDPGTSPLWAPVPADPRWSTLPEEPPRRNAAEYPFEYEPEYTPEQLDARAADSEAESDAAFESSDEEPPLDDVPLALPLIVTPPPRAKANVLTPSAFPRVEAAMMDVVDRDRLIELAFSVATCFALHSALFVVQQGTLQGLRYAERGATPRPLEGVLVPAGSDSMLTLAAAGAKPLRADPAQRLIDQHVRELLNDRACREAALFPVTIKQRVVNVLYASNGDEPLGEIAFAALTALAERMGAGYEKLIRSRKAG